MLPHYLYSEVYNRGARSNMRENATLKECVCHLVRCLEILSGTAASVAVLFSGFLLFKKGKCLFFISQSGSLYNIIILICILKLYY